MAKRDNIDRWPVIWRVVAPACGSYDHDWVFLETKDEAEARHRWRGLRRTDWPVRLERVQCGPMPQQAKKGLESLRRANAQNPDTQMREVPGYWEVAHG